MSAALVVLLATLGADAGAPRWLPPGHPVDLSASRTASYRLRRFGDGYRYDDLRFEARIARDGAVTFKDKRLDIKVSGVLEKGPPPGGPTLESTLRDHFGKRRRARAKPTLELAPSPTPPPQMVPSEVCPPSSSCYFLPVQNAIEVSGSFDLTDEIMRSRGRAAHGYEKARFLSATFELRMRMATRARKEDLTSSLEHLPERLDDLLRDERYTERERRRILYELWYETDQTPDGERAASTIDAFIRRRLPCGSALGYTSEELESLRKLHPEHRLPAAADCASVKAP